VTAVVGEDASLPESPPFPSPPLNRFLVASGFYRTFPELSSMLQPLMELLDGATIGAHLNG
jgi:hypothetical protein